MRKIERNFYDNCPCYARVINYSHAARKLSEKSRAIGNTVSLLAKQSTVTPPGILVLLDPQNVMVTRGFVEKIIRQFERLVESL